jgi:hypothetical protein
VEQLVTYGNATVAELSSNVKSSMAGGWTFTAYD